MGTLLVKDAKLYVAQYNLSGVTNQGTLNFGVEPQDVTVFGKGTRIMTAGLETFGLEFQGFAEFGSAPDLQDKVIFDRIGSNNVPMTVAPSDGLENSPAYFLEGAPAQYQLGGAVGALLPFRVTVAPSTRNRLVKGTILEDAQTARTASGAGTGRNLGSVLSTQKLYAVLHLLTFTGFTSIDIIVESDDASGFLSPITRISFANATAPTSEFKSAAGPITDTWFRVKWTFNGGGPGSATFVVVVGIK